MRVVHGWKAGGSAQETGDKLTCDIHTGVEFGVSGDVWDLSVMLMRSNCVVYIG